MLDWELFFFYLKNKIQLLDIVRIRPRGKREKKCFCFDSALLAFTWKGFVHNFELGSREFLSLDQEFKSDRNVFCYLLELFVTNEKEKVLLSILRYTIQRKGDHAPRWSMFVIGLEDLADYHRRNVNRITRQRYDIFYYMLIN